MPARLLLAATALAIGVALRAQTPDAARLDEWWLDACSGDSPSRAQSLALLRQHADPAARRGVVLLRSDDEPSGQELAFEICELGVPGFEALLRECVRADSPARAHALEGAMWYRSRHMDDDPDYARRSLALNAAIVACLDAKDEELMRQVGHGLANLYDDTEALLERRLTEPAPIGPRAAVFLAGRRPRPPLLALIAALADPLASIQGAAAMQLGERDDPAATAAMVRMFRGAPPDSRRATIERLSMWSRGPWSQDITVSLSDFVGGALPQPLDHDWFEDLEARQRLVESTVRGITAGEPEAEQRATILLAALRLPHSDAGWISYRVDQLQVAALRGLLVLGERAPPETGALVTALAERDSLSASLLPAVLEAMHALAATQIGDPGAWAARCRTAIETASIGKPGKPMAHDTARILAAAFDGLGKLDDTSSLAWLRDQLDLATEARGAVAGALVRLAGGEPTTRALVRSYLLASPSRWPHDEVLAAALADQGGDWAWAAALLLDRLPEQAVDDSRAIVARLVSIALQAGVDDREEIRDYLLARLRKNPQGSHAEHIAVAIARIDLDLALALRDAPDIGQRLYLAVLATAPARLVALLDDELPRWRARAHETLKSYGRPDPATITAFAELLRRPELRDARLVLETLAKIGPPAELLPLIEAWLPRSPAALRAMVAVGEPAVARIIAVALPSMRSERELDLLRPLGEHAAALCPLLLQHPSEHVREMAPLTLPYFGRAGIAALRTLGKSEAEFCALLTPVLLLPHASVDAQVAVAEELLQHPDVPDIGYYDLARSARSPKLAELLLLLQGNRDPHGAGATDALLDTLAASDARLRAFALRRLAGHPDHERIARYVHWLREDPDPSVQRALMVFDATRGK